MKRRVALIATLAVIPLSGCSSLDDETPDRLEELGKQSQKVKLLCTGNSETVKGTVKKTTVDRRVAEVEISDDRIRVTCGDGSVPLYNSTR